MTYLPLLLVGLVSMFLLPFLTVLHGVGIGGLVDMQKWMRAQRERLPERSPLSRALGWAPVVGLTIAVLIIGGDPVLAAAAGVWYLAIDFTIFMRWTIRIYPGDLPLRSPWHYKRK